MAMQQLVPYVVEKSLVIKAFCEDGKPCYEGKSPFGHIWWDICVCDECKEEDDDQPRRRKKKSLQQSLKEKYEVSDPEVDLLGELFGKFDYYVLYPRTRKQKPQSPPSTCKEPKPKQDTNHEPKPPLIPYY